MIRKTRWQLPPPSKPVTDEYLASVTVGEREALDGPIRLVPYDPRWPAMFCIAADEVRAALSEGALLIEHVGSTAVVGLSGKPIIDMVLGVRDSTDEVSYVPPLEARGFTLRAREPAWFQHRFLVLESGETTWQLHVFSAGCEEIDRMLAFRDWLRAHDEDRRLYESAKMELAARTWRHVQNYADAKSGVVRQILERAREGRARREPAAGRPARQAARSTPSSLRLCRVTRENSSDLEEYSREFAEAGESCVALPYDDPEAFLARVESFEAARDLPENRVRMSWFWLLRGDRIVASSRLRHELIPVLLLDGGNVGYEVRPSERRCGVGRLLLRLTLEEARRIGLRRVLLTTEPVNRGSIGVILANGGVFDDTSVSPNTGRTLNRYWITL